MIWRKSKEKKPGALTAGARVCWFTAAAPSVNNPHKQSDTPEPDWGGGSGVRRRDAEKPDAEVRERREETKERMGEEKRWTAGGEGERGGGGGGDEGGTRRGGGVRHVAGELVDAGDARHRRNMSDVKLTRGHLRRPPQGKLRPPHGKLRPTPLSGSRK